MQSAGQRSSKEGPALRVCRWHREWAACGCNGACAVRLAVGPHSRGWGHGGTAQQPQRPRRRRVVAPDQTPPQTHTPACGFAVAATRPTLALKHHPLVTPSKGRAPAGLRITPPICGWRGVHPNGPFEGHHGHAPCD
eukprot:364743-Chlamydomonas_euryale.AAC.10